MVAKLLLTAFDLALVLGLAAWGHLVAKTAREAGEVRFARGRQEFTTVLVAGLTIALVGGIWLGKWAGLAGGIILLGGLTVVFIRMFISVRAANQQDP